jgi:hypothetical protein
MSQSGKDKEHSVHSLHGAVEEDRVKLKVLQQVQLHKAQTATCLCVLAPLGTIQCLATVYTQNSRKRKTALCRAQNNLLCSASQAGLGIPS